ncbi:MAG: DUF1295 domain-containing protein [bacterium]|nr:DUF1295 domain-containing protein [bacterium]
MTLILREILLPASCALAIYMLFWFVVSILAGRNDVADVAWGPGFILVGVAALLKSDWTPRMLVLLLLVAVWGARLFTHIYLRNRGKGEDPRYKRWREEWGRWAHLRSLFQVFALQGALILVIASPLLIVSAYDAGGFTLLNAIGVAVWLAGFLFEVVGDLQLARFLRDSANRGSVMQEGLWHYTRHPNYFGEVTLWWGIFLVGLSGSPAYLSALISPITITFLILRVSGIPMLERKREGDPKWESYRRRTSAFLPLPPRRTP